VREDFSRPRQGVSGAQFEFLNRNKNLYLRKTTSSQPQKLMLQYQWLKERSGLKSIPLVDSTKYLASEFSYEVIFFANSHTLIDFVATHTAEQIEPVFLNLRQSLKEIYTFSNQDFKAKCLNPVEMTFDPTTFVKYIEVKLMETMRLGIRNHLAFKSIIQSSRLSINGDLYKNIIQIAEVWIYKKPPSLFRGFFLKPGSIHGDLAGDNILVTSKNEIILIDPNPQQAPECPLVDLGKLLQSFHSGFHLFHEESIEVEKNQMTFARKINPCRKHLPKVLSIFQELFAEDIYPTALFHESMHLVRILPYLLDNPSLWFRTYAQAVINFNELDAILSERDM
jgi:hypothetical protein